MSIVRKIKRALRGEVEPSTVAREALRRAKAKRAEAKERASLDSLNSDMPKLWLLAKDQPRILEHFKTRAEPHFFAGFTNHSLASLQRDLFPSETNSLIENAEKIVELHSWPLLGFGLCDFGKEIKWCRDPLSGFLWPLDYHKDLKLIRNDGSDARVLWELNRLGHLLTLARAYVVSGDEKFSIECFAQVR